MQEIARLFHSPHHLLVFDAAARHLSFTKAARELNVSQPAVSLAIKQFETALGLPVFVRHHRAIELTDAGAALAEEVSQALTRIVRTARALRRRQDRGHVTLSVSTAFANYWMVPRLGRFHADHPDIELRLQTTDKDLDLYEEGLHLGVRRGTGGWADVDGERIAPEVLFPVASPKLTAYLRGIRTVGDLTHARLIHLEEPFRPRPTWRDWFAALGQSYTDRGEGLRLNDYALVIQAAMAGEGIALGWRHVLTGLIEQRLLMPVHGWEWRSDQGFYLVWPKEAPLPENARAVRDWIIAVAREAE